MRTAIPLAIAAALVAGWWLLQPPGAPAMHRSDRPNCGLDPGQFYLFCPDHGDPDALDI